MRDERQRAYERVYYAKNRKRIQLRRKKYYAKNRQRYLNGFRDYFQKVKKDVINKYGGKCVCCGEHRLAFLTIEHINHDGQTHRAKSGGPAGLYYKLRRSEAQDNITILCYNCNLATRYGKACPHKIETCEVQK